jgi:hypothetical protein
MPLLGHSRRAPRPDKDSGKTGPNSREAPGTIDSTVPVARHSTRRLLSRTCRKGLESTSWPGRRGVVRHGPEVGLHALEGLGADAADAAEVIVVEIRPLALARLDNPPGERLADVG